MKCTGLKAVSYPDTRMIIKGSTVQFGTNTRIFYIVCYSQLIYRIMEKMTLKPIGSGSEIYSNQFKYEGWYIVDQVDLRPNNPVSDKRLVAVIKAHLREMPDFKVEATSDKFHF